MPGNRKSSVRFRERAELLDFLLEVAAATSETLELDRLLENVGKIVAQVIPHELFALLLYSEKRGGLRIHYATGHREEVVRNLVIPLGEGITGAAARDGLLDFIATERSVGYRTPGRLSRRGGAQCSPREGSRLAIRR